MRFSLPGSVSKLEFSDILRLAISQPEINMADRKPEIVTSFDSTEISTSYVILGISESNNLKQVQLTMFY